MPTHLDLIVNHHRKLNEAARVGDLARLRALLASGADANATNACGSTVLHAAASWSDLAAAEILIGHGADLHARDWEGDTPLHIAAAFGDKAILGLLLDRGADIHGRNDVGWTPLHVATRIGRVDEAAFLLSRGADAGARDEQGRTPLDVALCNRFLKDRWGPLTRLLGGGKLQAEARQPSPSPADLLEQRGTRLTALTVEHPPQAQAVTASWPATPLRVEQSREDINGSINHPRPAARPRGASCQKTGCFPPTSRLAFRSGTSRASIMNTSRRSRATPSVRS